MHYIASIGIFICTLIVRSYLTLNNAYELTVSKLLLYQIYTKIIYKCPPSAANTMLGIDYLF